MKKLHEYTNRFRILKGGKISLIVSSLLATTSISFAAPSGGVVTSGNASISQNGTITNINQITNKASINWNKFNISKNETVNFNQPNSSSITLNKIVGNETSVINGALNANGQVWILNSNGILFGKSASINTSGLLATTKNISDTDFQEGNYTFSGDSSASVINQGTINIKNNGSVIFASNEVKNSGVIKTIAGTIHLTAAKEYTINLNGNSLVNLKVKKGVLDALVENSGTIIADGGEIYLTTNAVDELLKGVVNNTGIVEANSFNDVKGKIELFAHGGEVQIGGTISATDGFVETSGKDFTILDDAKITAGEWLIDPVNITIDNAAAYEYALNNGTDTLIQTDNVTGSDEGNIYVNETIAWNTSAKLTLDAYNNIYINADIDVTGAGTLALYYGQGTLKSGNTSDYYINAPVNLSSSSSFITNQGSDGSDVNWTIVNDITSLQNIALTGNYVLGSDIDASDTINWNSGAGFNPIGDFYNSFFGNIDGLGHTIDKLFINRNSYNIGLISYSSSSIIRDIGLTNVNIKGSNATGGLVGTTSSSSITNSYVTGTISGAKNVGGLVGYNSYSTITNSYVDGSISGAENVGGLVGINNFSISNSYASGSVSGNNYVGGLVGYNSNSYGYSLIFNSYASGSISGNTDIGGLIGYNNSYYGNSSISNSYWNINTTGQSASSGGEGATTAQLQDILANNSLVWDMEYFSGTENPTLAWQHSNSATTTTWVMGTPLAIIEPEAYLPPVSTPIQSNQERVNKIITPINNKTLTNTPKKQSFVFNNYKNTQVNKTQNSIVSAVETNSNKKLVSLSELKNQTGTSKVRVPLNDNSIITLVDNALNLPAGTEQEFYINENNK